MQLQSKCSCQSAVDVNKSSDNTVIIVVVHAPLTLNKETDVNSLENEPYDVVNLANDL